MAAGADYTRNEGGLLMPLHPAGPISSVNLPCCFAAGGRPNPPSRWSASGWAPATTYPQTS